MGGRNPLILPLDTIPPNELHIRLCEPPRVYEELQKRGVPFNRKHVAYLMRKHGLRSRHYKRPKGLTQVDRCRKAAPNLVDQYFETDQQNSIWKADITYIPTGEGWLYLAAVMDLCTRKVVGWSLKDMNLPAFSDVSWKNLRMSISLLQTIPGQNWIKRSF